jgi:hypothetical protein
MTWRQIKTFLDLMDDMTLNSAAKIFDYDTDKFYEPSVQLEGDPEFHLTIN